MMMDVLIHGMGLVVNGWALVDLLVQCKTMVLPATT